MSTDKGSDNNLSIEGFTCYNMSWQDYFASEFYGVNFNALFDLKITEPPCAPCRSFIREELSMLGGKVEITTEETRALSKMAFKA